jgi:hypothetical protein
MQLELVGSLAPSLATEVSALPHATSSHNEAPHETRTCMHQGYRLTLCATLTGSAPRVDPRAQLVHLRRVVAGGA